MRPRLDPEEGAEVHGMMYGAAAAFLIYFALPAIRPLLRV
jgi:hypothetical protein